jgi:O-antigen ligase
MLGHRISRDFLFFLFAAYYGLNCLFIGGSVLSQICVVSSIVFSGIYFVKTLLQDENKSLLYYAWTLMIILNIVGFCADPDLSEGPERDMIKNILAGMLTFYPFYYFAGKGLLKARHLTVFLVIMIPVLIILFFTVKSDFAFLWDVDESEVVNNVAYSFAGFIPFVFLIKKNKILSGGLMVVLIFFIMYGAKRGAILTGMIGLAMYFYYLMITIEKNNRLAGYLTAFIIVAAIVAFSYEFMARNDFLVGRLSDMMDGDTSNRNFIYKSIVDTWYNSDSILKLVFGYGFAASVKIAGIYAHNDWLELLSNFGLLGIFAYMNLFRAAARCSLNKIWAVDKRILMITVTLMWFLISMVSMAYTDQGFFMQAILLGYITGSKVPNLE